MSNQWIPHERETWPWRFGRLKRDVEFRTWHGHNANPEFTCRIVAAGTVCKIVMVSRFGDVGVTTDISRDTGYEARILLTELEQCEAPQ